MYLLHFIILNQIKSISWILKSRIRFYRYLHFILVLELILFFFKDKLFSYLRNLYIEFSLKGNNSLLKSRISQGPPCLNNFCINLRVNRFEIYPNNSVETVFFQNEISTKYQN